MLIAEKQQYLESYDAGKHQNMRVVKNPKVSPKAKVKRKNKVLPVVMILAGFALCSLTVARYALIAQNHSDILKLEKELEKEYKREEQLKLELSYSKDLKRIEEFAKNNLGMGYPDESQVLYVELPQQNQDEADKKEGADEKVEMARQDKENLWNRIISLLD